MNIIGLLEKIAFVNAVPVLAFNIKGVAVAAVLVSLTGFNHWPFIGYSCEKV
jgi:hypothetical protein